MRLRNFILLSFLTFLTPLIEIHAAELDLLQEARAVKNFLS